MQICYTNATNRPRTSPAVCSVLSPSAILFSSSPRNASDTLDNIPHRPLSLLLADQALSLGQRWSIERLALQHLLHFFQVERLVLYQRFCKLQVS